MLIGIGLPNLNQFLAAQKTNTQVNELINTIKEAKATALTLNTQTLIIPTAGDYSNGWQMGLDTDSNGTIDTIMRVSLDAEQLQFASSPEIIFTDGGRLNPVQISITHSLVTIHEILEEISILRSLAILILQIVIVTLDHHALEIKR